MRIELRIDFNHGLIVLNSISMGILFVILNLLGYLKFSPFTSVSPEILQFFITGMVVFLISIFMSYLITYGLRNRGLVE